MLRRARNTFAAVVLTMMLGVPAGTMVTVDGYYQPSGNQVTWPVGPSLA